MARIFKYGAPVAEVKDVNLKDRIIQAYYFNATNIDSDNDIISIDAYEKSIAERGPKSAMPRIKHLFNHWEGAGTLQELGKDDKGGWFISKLGRHTTGRDVLLMYEDGLITEHSHGFETVNATNETIEGKEIRRIKEGILWEVTSLDKWGANMNTPVIKSLDDQKYWEKRLDKLIKSLDRGAYTDETFEILEYQLRQIQEVLKESKPCLNCKETKDKPSGEEEPRQLSTFSKAGSQLTLIKTKVSFAKISLI
jgi:HK97 family phage prohead protease